MASKIELRAYQAKNLRYKKSVAAGLSLDDIRNELYDISAQCEEVRYACENEDFLIEALDGDEEQAFEFRMIFSDLSADCDRLSWVLDEEPVTEFFDIFFSRIASGAVQRFGYDAYEEDYYELCGYEGKLAQEEAGKKLLRLTKQEILQTAEQCFGVISAFLSVRYRYDYIKAAIDILNGKNAAYLEAVKGIEEAYEEMWRSRNAVECNSAALKRFDELITFMPDRVWLE